MFSRRRLSDKYQSWRKLFAQNWSLFRASRIGVVGLAIMIAFLLVAVAAPFMGLRDPLYWLAPESDTVSVKEHWRLEGSPTSPLCGNFTGDLCTPNGSVDHAIAFRLSPDAFAPLVDRVYVPEGRNLFAIRTATPTAPAAWGPNCFPFRADAVISVDPVLVNYGSFVSPTYGDIVLLFGTRNGTVYALSDNTSNASCPTPLTTNLGSPITGLAGLTVDELCADPLTFHCREARDGFVVGTEDGNLTAFTVNETVAGATGPFYREVWRTSLGSTAIHMTGFVVKTTSSSPTVSPAFFQSSSNATERLGEKVYVGDSHGNLYAVWMSNGSINWTVPLLNGVSVGAIWTSAPIVMPAAELTLTTPTVVYAAVQDRDRTTRENVTKVYVLRADDGTPLRSWDPTGDGGLSIAYRGRERGIPSTPAVLGPSIFLASTSGWLYRINRDPTYGADNVLTIPAGTVKWAYQEGAFKEDATHHTAFNAPAYVFKDNNFILATASWNNGTANPSDDVGIVYAFNNAQDQDFAKPSWRKTFFSGINSMPVAWMESGVNRVYPTVFFGTHRGDVYSYSASGAYLAPLEPSWVHSYLDGNVRRSGYPSGNTYILGTDARGRDIFSQLLWGSRVALLVGFASAFFTISIGVIIGLVAGYLGGRVESILMRFTDVILVIPGLPLVIILAAVLGAGVGNIILVIAIVGWPGVARVIRAEVLSLKERPFIDSARVTGASNVRIMFRHIAPNVAPLAFLYMTFAVSGAILTEAALSFIGLGDVNTISWGIMLQDVSQSKALQAWWWLLPPGLAITLISLAFFLVGRAFDEIVNPRLRKR